MTILQKYSIAELKAMLEVDPQKAQEVMLQRIQEVHMKAVLMEAVYKENSPQESARYGVVASEASDFIMILSELILRGKERDK